ncbi:MAG TPA: AAA family ATPase [Williamwhitmania sp.]|nr:AAA family ATPase [Williamwhitmania sp.]
MESNATPCEPVLLINPALVYFDKGILTVPVRLSDGKPMVDLERFLKEEVTRSDLKIMFEEFDTETYGIAILTNSRFGNCEGIRFRGSREEIRATINDILSSRSLQHLSSENKILINSHAEGFDIIYMLPEMGLSPVTTDEKIDIVGNRKPYIEVIGKDGYLIVFPTKGYGIESKNFFSSTISISDRNTLIELALLYDQPLNSYMDGMVYGRKEYLVRIANEYNANSTSKSTISSYLREELKWERHTKNIWVKRISDTEIVYGSMDFIKQDSFFVLHKIGPFEPKTLYKPFDIRVIQAGGDYLKVAYDVCSKIPKLDAAELLRHEKILQDFRKSHVSIMEEYIESDPIIYTEDDGGKYEICSKNNISVLSGKAKVGKTLLLSEVISSAFMDNGVFLFSPSISGKKVVYFDTEQSRNHSRKINERVLQKSKKSKAFISERFELYNITKLSPKERVEVIEDNLYSDSEIAILIIDGIVDLIGNYNNPEEVSVLMSKLLKWKDENPIHIMVVIHENKGNSLLRGHLGTELMNKAETIIGVSKTKDIIKVKCKASRNRDFEPKAFKILEGGFLEPITKLSDKKEDNSIENYTEDEHIDLLATVFDSVDEMQYKELITNLKESLLVKFEIKIGVNKVKSLISKYCEDHLLQKVRKGVYSFKFDLVGSGVHGEDEEKTT